MNTIISFDNVIISAILRNDSPALDVLDRVETGSPLEAQLDRILDASSAYDYAASTCEGEDPQAAAVADELIRAMPANGCNYWSDTWTDADELALEAQLDRILDNCPAYDYAAA